jgi:hypothetical protein
MLKMSMDIYHHMQPAVDNKLYYVPSLPKVIRHTPSMLESAMALWDRCVRPQTHFYDCIEMLKDDEQLDDAELTVNGGWVGIRNTPVYHELTVDGFHITVEEEECIIEGYRRNVFAGIDGDDRLIIVTASYRVIVFTQVDDDVWDYEVYASVTSYLKADGRYPGFMTSRPCDLLCEFCRIVYVDEGKHVPADAGGVIIKRYPLLDAVDRPTHCRSEPRTLPTTGVPVSQMNVSIFQGFIG